MLHEMNLYPESYLAIKNKTKTVEMRLHDEKRALIQPGDVICFRNTETKECLQVLVLKTEVFQDFNELYSHFDKVSIGYEPEELANPRDMELYYKKEDIEKYGAFAITIQLMEDNKYQ